MKLLIALSALLIIFFSIPASCQTTDSTAASKIDSSDTLSNSKEKKDWEDKTIPLYDNEKKRQYEEYRAIKKAKRFVYKEPQPCDSFLFAKSKKPATRLLVFCLS